MPRSSRVAEAAAERGLIYDPATRTARAPGPGGPVFSRRQLDKLRDQPPPFAVADDSQALATFVRQRRAAGEAISPVEAMGDARLLSAITIMRRDALQPSNRRTDSEAKAFAWALRRLHGKRRIEWTRYTRRR